MQPSRRFKARKGQRNLPGHWWSATDARHVGYESWLERDHLVALDFDRSVAGIASQPFWLYWTDPEGQRASHAPDYFARRADGSAVVLDCRPWCRWTSDRRPVQEGPGPKTSQHPGCAVLAEGPPALLGGMREPSLVRLAVQLGGAGLDDLVLDGRVHRDLPLSPQDRHWRR